MSAAIVLSLFDDEVIAGGLAVRGTMLTSTGRFGVDVVEAGAGDKKKTIKP